MPPADLTALRERIAALEEQRAALERHVTAQRADTLQVERVLAELQRGLFPPRRRRRLLVALLVIATLGGAAGWLARRAAVHDESLVRRAALGAVKDILTPQLLLTSVPSGAAARVDGHLAGLTPLLLSLAPVSRTYVVLLEAPGHLPFVRRVGATREGGVHLHAVLALRPAPAATPTPP